MLGILGGMGPLASAEFLKTIYEYNQAGELEQNLPRIFLYSDPSFPDRTQALVSGEYDQLLQQFTTALSDLNELPVSKIIICCLTSHYLLPQLPQALKHKVLSLIEVVLEAVLTQKRQYLLLCTNGTQKLKIFQSHPLWHKAQDYIIVPNDIDQQAVHQMIYQIKIKQQAYDSALFFLQSLLSKYHADSMIAGCTEIHLLYRYAQGQYQQYESIFLDPLVLIAQQLKQYCIAENFAKSL